MNGNLKFVAVKSSQGCLGKNLGTELAPEVLLRGFNDVVEAPIVNDNIIETNKVLEKSQGEFFIGGDHSITYSLFKGLKNKYKNIGLVVFDAHPDCVNNFSPPTHEDFVRVLIEEKILKPENIFLIGVRKMDQIEEQYLKTKKIRHILMRDVKDCNVIIEELKSFVKKFDAWYLSIDIDCLDPLHAPGTGYIEKRGFKLVDLLYILGSLRDLKNLKRIDLVEVNPLKDKRNRTITSAQKIINEFVRK